MHISIQRILIYMIPWLLIASCKEDDLASTEEWLIPINEVRDGGPGKDGIPALGNPEMVEAGAISYLDSSDLIIGFQLGKDVRAYPHKILDWHEIINDVVSGTPIAITYCPLTGTGIGWDRNINGQITSFGVSGLLYNTNLIPYDRATDSNWSQIGLQSVNGPMIGTDVNTFQVFETTWYTWKKMFPDTRVVSLNTGHSRNYQRYPYGNYRTEQGLIFSVSVNDERLPQKERVHGIIVDTNVKAYQFKNFGSFRIIEDEFQGEQLIIIGSEDKNFIVSFYSTMLNGEPIQFEMADSIMDGVILKDQFGNRWSIFGTAISGPNTGKQLEATNSFMGMWFSWAPFYGNPEIYSD